MTDVQLRTAADVLSLNSALDEELLRTAASLDPARLDEPAAEGEWTPRQTLAHLAEFPHFFAGELRRHLADRKATIGRTHEHAGRLAAVEPGRARGRDKEELLGEVRSAFGDLAGVLQRLSDTDLDSITQNVKYGEEPLRVFLDRYVISHKAGHLNQLRATGGPS